jgi:hypothetical protein
MHWRRVKVGELTSGGPELLLGKGLGMSELERYEIRR